MDLVIYPRVSDPKQAKKDLSIPEQIREMERYCRTHRHNVVKVYEGEAASGRDERRPVFQRMIEELLSGMVKAQGILVYTRSRFFRDFVKAHYYEERLKKKGIQVISITMPTENLNEAVANAFKNFEYTVSQLQSDLNALHTLAGMKANARKGYFNGGIPPFGYQIKKVMDEYGNPKSALEICPVEVEVILRIFRIRVQKALGAKQIASTFNSEDLTKRNGRRWTKDNVLAILSNPIYKGERIYNRYDSKTRKEKPEDQQIKVRIDPIVEKAVFDEAQRIMRENSPKKTNPAIVASRTLLSGILQHICHRSMTLETGKGGKYQYYNCRGYLREGSCSGQRIPVELLDREVLEHLISKFFSVRRLTLLARLWLRERKRGRDYVRQEKTPILAQLRDEERKLDNIYKLIEEGSLKEGNINERIETRRRSINLLERRLIEIRKLRSGPVPSQILSLQFVQDIRRKVIWSLRQDTKLAKRYIKLFVERIQVNGENVTIVARSDILPRAISLQDERPFAGVPTAGGAWLPGQDSNLFYLPRSKH